MKHLIGPFSQIITMDQLPERGPISDENLLLINDGGILVEEGVITRIGRYEDLPRNDGEIISMETPCVVIPGLIDAHTHLCFAGSREKDYALRVSGITYQDIAARGGGILDTVSKTREATKEELQNSLLKRLEKQLRQGITTCEIKSGYGLTVQEELKMLRTINQVVKMQPIDIIPTCLAAHTLPVECSSPELYLAEIVENLFPLLKKESLTRRIDIFIEQKAFSPLQGLHYLTKAKQAGFEMCVHANQFTTGGVEVACSLGALSADHLEVLSENDCKLLSHNNVVAIVLPGASLGLGMAYAPARMLLNHGVCLAIASDWNPGSAPMGQILTQAATMGAFEKLSLAETFAGLTFRAAMALNLSDRGILRAGLRADFAVFSCKDFREILYYQGAFLPSAVFIKGKPAW